MNLPLASNEPSAGVVLIVDDDETIRETLSLGLEIEGYLVIAAENGKEALELLHKIEKPFLILLDLMMPVMDGWSFLTELRKSAELASIPVLIITAHAQEGEIPEAQGVIIKPIEIRPLFEQIKRFRKQALERLNQ